MASPFNDSTFARPVAEVTVEFRDRTPTGDVILVQTSRYDASGRLVEEIERSNRFATRRVFEYDDGHLIFLRWFDVAGKLAMTVTHEYDALGRERQITTVDASGDVIHSRSVTYSDNGDRFEEEHLGQAADMLWIADSGIMVRANRARIVRSRHNATHSHIEAIAGDGTVVARAEIERENGRIRKVWSETEGLESTATYDYDASGRLTGDAMSSFGFDAFRHKYVFDEAGNVREVITHDADAVVQHFEIEHVWNDAGDWVERRTIDVLDENRQVRSTVVRRITYR